MGNSTLVTTSPTHLTNIHSHPTLRTLLFANKTSSIDKLNKSVNYPVTSVYEAIRDFKTFIDTVRKPRKRYIKDVFPRLWNKTTKRWISSYYCTALDFNWSQGRSIAINRSETSLFTAYDLATYKNCYPRNKLRLYVTSKLAKQADIAQKKVISNRNSNVIFLRSVSTNSTQPATEICDESDGTCKNRWCFLIIIQNKEVLLEKLSIIHVERSIAKACRAPQHANRVSSSLESHLSSLIVIIAAYCLSKAVSQLSVNGITIWASIDTRNSEDIIFSSQHTNTV